MNALTHDFDLALQVREGVLNQLFRAMHRAGSVQHHFVRPFDGRRVELQIGTPRIELSTAAAGDSRARAIARTRLYYHARDIGDANDSGDTAVVDIELRAVLHLGEADPAPLSPETKLVADWNETTASDITVHGADAARHADIESSILFFVQRLGGGQFLIPELGQGAERIGSLSFRFIQPASAPEPILVVGLNAGGGIKGDKAGLTSGFLQGDWSLAASEAFIKAQILEQLEHAIGSVPPPHGPAPVTVSDRNVCTFPTPFGCADHSRQRVILERFDITLQSGKIVFTGTVHQMTDAWYIPDVTATFSAEATISLGNDQALVVTVGTPTVHIEDWFAEVLNFLSFDTLENVVRDAVQRALQSGAGQPTVPGVFSADMLEKLASLGSSVQLDVRPTATSVEVRPEAVVVHGAVAIQNISAAPQATLLSLPTSLTRRLLHGCQSWAPGGNVTRLRWEFGDGQVADLAGDQARIVVEHEYAPGIYRACVTIFDEDGRQAQSCKTLSIRNLTLRHTPPAGTPAREWQVCEQAGTFSVEFQVLDGTAPVPDALVRVFDPYGWQVQAYTDTMGKVALPVSADHFVILVGGSNVPNVTVEATKPTYFRARESLYMVDCAALGQLVGDLERFWDDLDRLIPIPLFGDGPVPPGDGDPIDPTLAGKVGDVLLARDALTTLVRVSVQPNPSLPMAALFGIDPGRDDANRQVAKRFASSFSMVLEQAKQVREQIDERGLGRSRQ